MTLTSRRQFGVGLADFKGSLLIMSNTPRKPPISKRTLDNIVEEANQGADRY